MLPAFLNQFQLIIKTKKGSKNLPFSFMKFVFTKIIHLTKNIQKLLS